MTPATEARIQRAVDPGVDPVPDPGATNGATNGATAGDARARRAYRSGFAVAWAIFWLLMLVLEIQDHRRAGHGDLWQPVLWQASACAVASGLAWLLWRWFARLDAWLDRPWQWFARCLVWIPLAAPCFVALVYAIRHAAYALLGTAYRHDAWTVVFREESIKFLFFYLIFAAIIFGIRSHAALGRAAVQLERERRHAQRAQLLQLTQQLEPHFLFNALNTIASTIHADPDLADTLLVRLSALLRAATDLARQPETTLDEELGLLESYVDIMRRRFADRVRVRFEVDAAVRGARVPTLVMQPLVENAFRHGVEGRLAPTSIVVRCGLAGGRLRLEVEDDAGELPDVVHFGVGLSNLQRRLADTHGATASFLLEHAGAPGVRGVRARVELPCVR
ncbi:MAG: sensor histidine kinase [Lautropia sp.]